MDGSDKLANGPRDAFWNPCIAGGAVVSLLLWRRPFNVPHIDARHADAKKPAYKPIEPN